MTNCTQESFGFPRVNRRRVEASFDGGDITSDGGVLLLRQADHRLGLSAAVAAALVDSHRRASCEHDVHSLLRQGLYAIALGYEDLNDHEALRQDVAMQTALERDHLLASASTLCRFENRADRDAAWRMHEVLLDQFIDSLKRPPKKLILDFDATDDAVHGEQDGRFFHGFYNHYCFFPLYVFCGDQLLVSYLRPSNLAVLNTAGPFSVCWSNDCDRCGRRCRLSSAETQAFAAGKCCAGASVMTLVKSSDWLKSSV